MGAFNIRNLVREIQGKYLPKPTTTEDGKVITYNDTTQSFEYNEYANTASNLGTSADGEGLYDSKVGVDLQFKRIKAGSNVILTSEDNDIIVSSTGGGAGSYNAETPIGDINSSNVTFTLASIPVTGSLILVLDGIVLDDGDYSIVDDTITFITAPTTGSKLSAFYVTGLSNVLNVEGATIWNAAGDLAVGTGNDSASVLSLGDAGKFLKSNGTTLEYDNIQQSDVSDLETILSEKATKTTATTNIYVDKAATGAGDGTSWTDAFTTIQSAIDSLPVVLEHVVTIIVRKGTTAYDEAVSISQITGKGSLRLRGEYYWKGGCAEATAGASSTAFDITATDGAQIAVGDTVLIRNGYADYIYTTVASTTDNGFNVWTITVNDALPTGNISTGDYYTICKTKIAPTTGSAIYIDGVKDMTLAGLYLTATSNSVVLKNTVIKIDACVLVTTTSAAIYSTYGAIVQYIYSSYLYAETTQIVNEFLSNGITFGTFGAVANGCVLASGSGVVGVYYTNPCKVNVYWSIIDTPTGTGISLGYGCNSIIRNTTISPSGRTAATTGILVSNAIVMKNGTINNNATTPESGSVAVYGYIGA